MSQCHCFVLYANHYFPSLFANIHGDRCHLILCSTRASLSQGLGLEAVPYKHGSTGAPGPPAQLVSVSADGYGLASLSLRLLCLDFSLAGSPADGQEGQDCGLPWATQPPGASTHRQPAEPEEPSSSPPAV